MKEDDRETWQQSKLRAFLLGAIIFFITTAIGVAYLQTDQMRGRHQSFDEEIVIPKG